MPLKVLFVCVGNSCRSQMAEGFARALGGKDVEAWSAGSAPLGWITPETVVVMKEKGVDVSGQRSKGLSEVPQSGWDYVVTMGCGDACPFVPSRKKLDWKIADPYGEPISEFRRVRDEIEAKVRALLEEAR